MASTPVQEIETLARRVIESEGLELVDLEFKEGKSRHLLRIYIDKPGGVTLSDCENVSHQVSTLLDVQDLVKNAYVLEVSSPGIGRPFKSDRDYDRAMGRLVKVVFGPSESETEQAFGKLLTVEQEEIRIEDQRGNSKVIPRNQIRKIQEDLPAPVSPKQQKKKRK